MSRAVIYPNPASGTLNVQFNDEAITQRQAVQRVAQVPGFDIRLYDTYGVLQRRASAESYNVQFNVSNLPNGIYFLHVYDGSGSNPPEVHKVIVKHE
ncbi:MAG: T9SS type A sorting domain-containing protein [Dysgonamonadaceae bacterium]|nr:T9SS type A sorting domain-containing protein [Dysgonamonadaceae bacterium]